MAEISRASVKIKANASRNKAMSYERMLKAEAEFKEQIQALLDKARAADEAEKNEPELDIPAELARRQDRLAQIEAAKQRLCSDCCPLTGVVVRQRYSNSRRSEMFPQCAGG